MHNEDAMAADSLYISDTVSERALRLFLLAVIFFLRSILFQESGENPRFPYPFSPNYPTYIPVVILSETYRLHEQYEISGDL